MVCLNVPLTNKQAAFLGSEARTVVFRGGVGAGKTRVLCIKAVVNATKGRLGAIISYSYPMLRDVIIPTLKSVVDSFGIKWDFVKNDMVVHIGPVPILLRSGEKYDRLRGLNLTDAYLDEAAYLRPEVIDIIRGRLRVGRNQQLFLATTPKGRRNWIYQEEQKPGVDVHVQSTMDNPFLPDEYILDLLYNYTTAFARQELFADFVDISGGVIDPSWFREVDYMDPIDESVRYWDLAVSTKKSADHTAGARVSFYNGLFVIHDMKHAKLEIPQVRSMMLETARLDGSATMIRVEEAGQQGGFIDQWQSEDEFAAYDLRGIPTRGDKLTRAMPWISRAANGHVVVCRGPWNEEFYSECAEFTADDSHSHDDQIDAVSGGWRSLVGYGSPGVMALGPRPPGEDMDRYVARQHQKKWTPRGPAVGGRARR